MSHKVTKTCILHGETTQTHSCAKFLGDRLNEPQAIPDAISDNYSVYRAGLGITNDTGSFLGLSLYCGPISLSKKKASSPVRTVGSPGNALNLRLPVQT